MAFDPDTRTLAWSSENGDLVLWDVAARKMLGSPLANGLVGNANRMKSIDVSPNGHWLAIANDNTVSMWSIDIDAWQRHACQLANRSLSPAEWAIYVGDEPYRDACSDLRYEEIR